jgi:hypothetical protein
MMTNEERIEIMLNMQKEMQDNPNFRLHNFDIYDHPEQSNAKVVYIKYTTKRGGVYELEDNWYLITDGKQMDLKQLITDKTSLMEFKSSLNKSNYALGGVVFN